MSVLLLDGFDQHAASGSDGGNLGRRWVGLASYNQGSSTPWSTGLSLAAGSGSGYRAFANTSTVILGFWFYPWGMASGSTVDTMAYLADGSSAQVILGFHTSGTLGVYRGTTSTLLGGSGSAVLTDQTWHRIEMKVVFHASAGSVEVRVNGTTRINLTGQNTLATANAYANRFYLDLATAGLQNQFDDLYLLDTSTPAPTDFLTDWRVRTLQPSAAGSSAQWTATGAATSWGAVNNVPPSTTDAVYAASSTSGHVDLHTLADPSGVVKGIKAIAVNVQARDDAGGSTSVRTAINSGGVTATGADQALTGSYQNFVSVHHTDPASSVATSIGYPTASGTTSARNISVLYAVRIIVPQAASLTAIKIMPNNTVGTALVKAQIWSDAGNYPGSLLAQSNAVTGVTASTAQTCTFIAPLAATENQVLWLGLHVGTAGFNLNAASSGGINYSIAHTYASGVPSSFPGGGSNFTSLPAIWVEGTATVGSALTVGTSSGWDHTETWSATATAGSRHTVAASGTLTTIKFEAQAAQAGSNVQGFIYADSSGNPGSLLATTNTQTGVTLGTNTLIIGSGGLAVTAGQVLWVGLQESGSSSFSIRAMASTGTNSYWSDTPPLDDPATGGGIFFSHAHQWAVWAEGSTPSPWTHYGIQALEAGYEAR